MTAGRLIVRKLALIFVVAGVFSVTLVVQTIFGN